MLVRAMAERGVSVRVVIDKGCLSRPSYRSQTRRLKEPARGSCGKLELRASKPEHQGEGPHNSMHAKQWIFDDAVLVTGSPNSTQQSERNFEEIVVLREVKAVDDARILFAAAWSAASRVPFEELYAIAEPVRVEQKLGDSLHCM